MPRRRLVVLVAAVLGLLLVAVPSLADAKSKPTKKPKPRALANGPLELEKVSITQEGVRLKLHLLTKGRWLATDLQRAPGRSICIALAQRAPIESTGLLCLSHEAHTRLAYARGQGGQFGAGKDIAATIRRPSYRSITAEFLPAAIGLAKGDYRWYAQTGWTASPDDDDDADNPDAVTDDVGSPCAQTCVSRIPDHGWRYTQASVYRGAKCFGAGSHDRSNPCTNKALRAIGKTQVKQAHFVPSAVCDGRTHFGPMTTCSFGAPAELAKATFVLAGDSHAAHWKPAIEGLTTQKRWRGISIFRSGCPTTTAITKLKNPGASGQCTTWNKALRSWFPRHPEVSVVFLSAHDTASVQKGQNQVQGYVDELRGFPSSVHHVFIIRDTPRGPEDSLNCVLANGRKAARRCGLKRGSALPHDPLVEAAHRVGGRVRVIDLTHFFCDNSYCPAVIGGAVVRRDSSHIATDFMETMSSYLTQAMDKLL